MNPFKLEYEARLRRLVGVTDDSVQVTVDCDWDYEAYSSDSRTPILTVASVDAAGKYVSQSYTGWYSHEYLMDELFKVEL